MIVFDLASLSFRTSLLQRLQQFAAELSQRVRKCCLLLSKPLHRKQMRSHPAKGYQVYALCLKLLQVMKNAIYGSVILSLTASIGVPQSLETSRKIDALMAAASLELQLHDYPSAWRSLEQASQADPNSARVRGAQEDAAMTWLENIHARGNESFSDIVKRLEPTLTRGVAAAQSLSRQADLMAHIGWSQFLRFRDGSSQLDPTKAYAAAVKIDANNPYAQAMWGFWVLWKLSPELPVTTILGTIGDAGQHFSLALTTGRQRAYVRNLQLAALMNATETSGANPIPSSNYALIDSETIRVTNAMRKEQGVVDPDNQRRIFGIYYSNMLHPDEPRFLRVVPPVEHLATFHWLFDGMEVDESKRGFQPYCLSALQEAAGQFEDALAGYRLIRRQMAGQSGPLLDGVESGIRRLTGTKGQ